MTKKKWIQRMGRILFPTLLLMVFCFSARAEENTYFQNIEPNSSFAENFNLQPYFVSSEHSEFGNFWISQPIEWKKEIQEDGFLLNKKESSVSPVQKQESGIEILEKRARLKNLDNSLFTASLVSLVALNVSDYLSTRKALTYEGLEEANPLMKPFSKNEVTFAAWKLGLTAANAYILKKLHSQNRALGWVINLVSQAVLSYVVVHNMEMIHRAEER